MTDHSAMRLGKKPAKHDPRVPRLAAYLPTTLPPPAAKADWYSKVPRWGMCGNDHAGDCAFAAVAHLRLQQTLYASGTGQLATDEQVLGWYAETTGYSPDDPNSDQGALLTDVLARWVGRGFEVGPATFERLAAYCYVSRDNTTEIKRAIEWFGGLYCGFDLPAAWQRAQGVWDVGPGGASGVWAPGSWGGHCVIATGYDEKFVYVVTWGKVLPVTWAAVHEYADELYCVLNEDWKKVPGFTPSGIAWTQLIADLDVVRSGG